MKAQGTIYEMWRRNSNRAWSTLNGLCESLTGVPYVAGHRTEVGENDAQAVAALHETLDAIQEAVTFLNFILEIEGGGDSIFEDRRQGLAALRPTAEWINNRYFQVTSPPVLRMAYEIVSNPRMYLHDEELEPDLIFIRQAPVWEMPSTVEQFDVFISYKHRDYADEIVRLSAALRAIGLSVWVDREQLALPDRVPREELARRLAYAIGRSKIMVFFETYNVATADEDYRGRKMVFNWQILEQRYGSTIIVVQPKERKFYFSSGNTRFEYGDVRDLAEQLAAYAAARQSPGGLAAGAPQEPAFEECLTALSDQFVEYFGMPLPISPQAAAALLAPNPGGEKSVALGDDILVGLLRQSPRSALALRVARLKPESVLAVGPDLSTLRWAYPSTFRFQDTFGHDPNHVRPDFPILDETSLLLGILAFAAQGSVATDLIFRALRFSAGIDAVSQQGSQTKDVGRVYDKMRAISGQGARPISCDQQWEIWRERGRWRLRPIASAGVWHLGSPSGSETDKDKPTNLVVDQTKLFYRSNEIAALEAMVNDAIINKGDASGIDAFLQEQSHLRRALAVKEWAIFDAIDITPDFPSIGRISLHPLEPQHSRSQASESKMGQWIVQTISSESEALLPSSSEETSLGALKASSRRVLVLGAPPRLMDSTADFDRLAFLDLFVSVLPALWSYLRFRDIDPAFLSADSDLL
jgi:hypothetical protein